MRHIKPIECLKEELAGWKWERKSMEDAIYKNDSSHGTDQVHALYKKALKDCDAMIKSYKEAIKKLKSK